MIDLTAIKVEGMIGARARVLYDAGITTPEALVRAPEEAVRRALLAAIPKSRANSNGQGQGQGRGQGPGRGQGQGQGQGRGNSSGGGGGGGGSMKGGPQDKQQQQVLQKEAEGSTLANFTIVSRATKSIIAAALKLVVEVTHSDMEPTGLASDGDLSKDASSRDGNLSKTLPLGGGNLTSATLSGDGNPATAALTGNGNLPTNGLPGALPTHELPGDGTPGAGAAVRVEAGANIAYAAIHSANAQENSVILAKGSAGVTGSCSIAIDPIPGNKPEGAATPTTDNALPPPPRGSAHLMELPPLSIRGNAHVMELSPGKTDHDTLDKILQTTAEQPLVAICIAAGTEKDDIKTQQGPGESAVLSRSKAGGTSTSLGGTGGYRQGTKNSERDTLGARKGTHTHAVPTNAGECAVVYRSKVRGTSTSLGGTGGYIQGTTTSERGTLGARKGMHTHAVPTNAGESAVVCRSKAGGTGTSLGGTGGSRQGSKTSGRDTLGARKGTQLPAAANQAANHPTKPQVSHTGSGYASGVVGLAICWGHTEAATFNLEALYSPSDQVMLNSSCTKVLFHLQEQLTAIECRSGPHRIDPSPVVAPALLFWLSHPSHASPSDVTPKTVQSIVLPQYSAWIKQTNAHMLTHCQGIELPTACALARASTSSVVHLDGLWLHTTLEWLQAKRQELSLCIQDLVKMYEQQAALQNRPSQPPPMHPGAPLQPGAPPPMYPDAFRLEEEACLSWLCSTFRLQRSPASLPANSVARTFIPMSRSWPLSQVVAQLLSSSAQIQQPASMPANSVARTFMPMSRSWSLSQVVAQLLSSSAQIQQVIGLVEAVGSKCVRGEPALPLSCQPGASGQHTLDRSMRPTNHKPADGPCGQRTVAPQNTAAAHKPADGPCGKRAWDPSNTAANHKPADEPCGQRTVAPQNTAAAHKPADGPCGKKAWDPSNTAANHKPADEPCGQRTVPPQNTAAAHKPADGPCGKKTVDPQNTAAALAFGGCLVYPVGADQKLQVRSSLYGPQAGEGLAQDSDLAEASLSLASIEMTVMCTTHGVPTLQQHLMGSMRGDGSETHGVPTLQQHLMGCMRGSGSETLKGMAVLYSVPVGLVPDSPSEVIPHAPLLAPPPRPSPSTRDWGQADTGSLDEPGGLLQHPITLNTLSAKVRCYTPCKATGHGGLDVQGALQELTLPCNAIWQYKECSTAGRLRDAVSSGSFFQDIQPVQVFVSVGSAMRPPPMYTPRDPMIPHRRIFLQTSYPLLPLVVLAHTCMDPHLCAALHSSDPWAAVAHHWELSPKAPLKKLLGRKGFESGPALSSLSTVAKHMVVSLCSGEGRMALANRLGGIERSAAAILSAGFVECAHTLAGRLVPHPLAASLMDPQKRPPPGALAKLQRQAQSVQWRASCSEILRAAVACVSGLHPQPSGEHSEKSVTTKPTEFYSPGVATAASSKEHAQLPPLDATHRLSPPVFPPSGTAQALATHDAACLGGAAAGATIPTPPTIAHPHHPPPATQVPVTHLQGPSADLVLVTCGSQSIAWMVPCEWVAGARLGALRHCASVGVSESLQLQVPLRLDLQAGETLDPLGWVAV
eukprot:gene22949-30133_t